MLNLYGVLIVCCVTLFVSVLSNEENYSNSWAVEVKGGHEAANALALKHGFINKGQVHTCVSVAKFLLIYVYACLCLYLCTSCLLGKHGNLSLLVHTYTSNNHTVILIQYPAI